MDFMNLNQAAHGDREFGFIAARMRLERKVVVGHWADAEVQERIGAWSAGRVRQARLGDRRGSPASARTCARSPSPRATRSRPSAGSASASTATASATSSAVVDAATDAEVDAADRGLPRRVRRRPRRSGPGGERAAALRDGARIELGLRRFLADGGFSAFTDTFEDLHGLNQLPGLGRPAADARRLRLRRPRATGRPRRWSGR